MSRNYRDNRSSRSNNNAADVNNTDMYVKVFDTRENAEADNRKGLLTVQAFDQGDFPIMAFLDKQDWADGEMVEHTFHVRVFARKPEQEAPDAGWNPKGSDAGKAAEAGESNADTPY